MAAIAVEMPAAAQGHSGTTGRYGRTEAQRVVHFLRTHLGARFQIGATGPRRFDCSGLVYRVYRQAGLLNRIGGKRRLASGYYHYFKRHGRASRHNPQVGDIVVWSHHRGGPISHSGIYVGHGHVISALINPWGVKRTTVHGVRSHFVAFLHVHLQR